jgi:zinc transporter ZupT
MPSGIILALLATVIGVATAALGVFSRVGSPRRIVPFSGGLLMGIALFAVIPELAEERGWPYALALVGTGVGLLWAFGRFVYPVCPSCSHTHDHEHCATTLHGFALPLMAAASLHAFLDGLGVAAAQNDTSKGLGVLVLGVVLHKIPEGIALGIMLRAAVKRNSVAFGLAALAEAATFFGGVLESAVTARFGEEWVMYALALAGGSFLYLGFHAIHGEWQRRGTPAFMPALTGAAGAAALQQGLRLFLR